MELINATWQLALNVEPFSSQPKINIKGSTKRGCFSWEQVFILRAKGLKVFCVSYFR